MPRHAALLAVALTSAVLAATATLDAGPAAAAAKEPAAPTAAPAAAATVGDKARAKELYLAAEKEFAAARYDAALLLYGDAYKAFPEPIFLFNIAQCHRLAKRYDQALFFYREYLRTKPDAPNRADVEALIDGLEKSAPPLVSSPPKVRTATDRGGPASGDGAVTPAPPAPSPAPAPTVSSRGAGVSPPGVALAAAGAAALGAAIFTGLAAQHANARLADGGRETEADFMEALAFEHRARVFGATTAVLVAAGGAVLAAGAVLVVLRVSSPRGDAPMVTAEIVGGPGLGLGLRGTFGAPGP